MANRKIDIELKVKDSGATSATNKVTGAFGKLNKTAAESKNKVVGAFAKMSEQGQKDAKKIADAFSKASSVMGNAFKTGGKLVVGAFAGITAAAIGAGFALKGIFEEASKQQKLERLFEGAPEVLERLQKQSFAAGISLENSREAIANLGRAFDPKRAEQLYLSLTDILSASGRTENLTQLTEELSELQIKLKNRQSLDFTDFEKIQKLAGPGAISLEMLAKSAGISIKKMDKAFKEGKIPIEALYDAMSKTPASSNILGAAAVERAAGNIDAQLTRAGDLFTKFKLNLVTAFGGENKAAAFLKEIVDEAENFISVENIIKTINKLKNAINDLTNALEKLSKWFSDNGPMIIGALTTIGLYLGYLAAPAIIAGIKTLTLLAIVYGATWLEAAIATTMAIAPILGIIVALGALGAAIGYIVKNWDKITEGFSYLYKEFINFGSNIIDGLWNGIKSGWTRMLDDFKYLIRQLPDSVKDILGINSPSIVFKGLGINTMDGLTEGLSEGAINSEEEINRVAELSKIFKQKSQRETSAINNVGPAKNISNTTNKTVNTVLPNININISVEAGANITKEEIAKAIDPQIFTNAIIDTFTRMGLKGA